MCKFCLNCEVTRVSCSIKKKHVENMNTHMEEEIACGKYDQYGFEEWDQATYKTPTLFYRERSIEGVYIYNKKRG